MDRTSPSRNHEGSDKDKPCVDCDLKGFDDLHCNAAGIAAQADYMKKYQPKLTERRGKFDTARAEYEQARAAVADDVDGIDNQLRRISEQLGCQVPDEQRECLENAWEKVLEQLRACGAGRGCCVTEQDCKFEWHFDPNVKTPEIQALIADFDKRVNKAEDCFDNTLITEPKNLKDRVKALKEFVAQIATAASDPNAADYTRAYAELLWAKYQLRNLWRGFSDANDYSDCLCLALNCSLKGRQALAKLTGKLEELTCQDKGDADRCQWLQTRVVDEIIATCRRMYPPKNKGESYQEASAW